MRLGWGSTTGEQGDEGPLCVCLVCVPLDGIKYLKGACAQWGVILFYLCLQSSYRAFKQMSHPVRSPLDSVRFIL